MGGHSHSKDSSNEVQLPGVGMNLGKIVVIGAASLALFAVGIIWAYFLMVGRQNEVRRLGPARVASEIGKQEIGIVDQVQFDVDTRLDDWRAEIHEKLTTPGWVDRAKRLARLPIEKGMERVVADPPDISGEGPVPQAMPVQVAPPMVAPSSPKSGRHP